MSGPGFLDDHANVAHGLLELHVATGDPRWLLEARRIADRAVELFADDERGGFFLAPHDGEPLATRAKDLDDDPTPSGNSMLASVLIRLGRIWGDDALVERGEGVLRLLAPAMERVPRAFSWALCTLHLHLSPPRELAIVGDVRSEVARAALAPFQPGDRRRRRPLRRGAAPRGERPRRRPAGGLRLRALRVPRARDARGGAQ